MYGREFNLHQLRQTFNTESAVDFHMPVLVMAEQIIHVVMAGEAVHVVALVYVPVFHLYWKNIY